MLKCRLHHEDLRLTDICSLMLMSVRAFKGVSFQGGKIHIESKVVMSATLQFFYLGQAPAVATDSAD